MSVERTRVYDFVGQILGSAFYGIHVCIFIMTICHMSLAKSRKMSVWSFAHSCAMFVFGTYQLVANVYDEFYYNWRNLPPQGNYERDLPWNVINLGASISTALSVFLQDGMLIYRLSAICNFSYMAMVLPMPAFLAATGLSIASVCSEFSSPSDSWKPQFAHPFVILSVTLNVTLTAAIIGRLLFLRSRIREFGRQHGRIYSNLAVMFFESGALYSVMGIIYLATLLSTKIDMFLLPFEQSAGIAAQLMWLRIAMGRSMTEDVTAYFSIVRCDVSDPVRRLGPTDLESALESPHSSSVPDITDLQRGFSTQSDTTVGDFADQTSPKDTLAKECAICLEPVAVANANDEPSTK